MSRLVVLFPYFPYSQITNDVSDPMTMVITIYNTYLKHMHFTSSADRCDINNSVVCGNIFSCKSMISHCLPNCQT